MNSQEAELLLEILDDIKGSLRTIAKELEAIPTCFENLINSINKEE